eukprot:92374-Pleurochrysis_carterae.AAC.1
MRAAKEAPTRYGPSERVLQLRSALRNSSTGVSARSRPASSGMKGAGGLIGQCGREDAFADGRRHELFWPQVELSAQRTEAAPFAT